MLKHFFSNSDNGSVFSRLHPLLFKFDKNHSLADWRHVVGVTLLAMATGNFAQAQGNGGDGPLTVTGTLDVIIAEDFDHGRTEMAYFVREQKGKKSYKLKFKQPPPGHWRTGQKVKVRGHAKGRQLSVEALEEESTSTSSSPLTAQAVTQNERHAVVLMVDLLDAKASTRYSLSQITDAMYTGTRSVADLYDTASHGQLTFDPDSDGDNAPDVFGPFTVAYHASSCDYYSWANAAESAAEAAGIDLSLYRHRVFVLPRSPLKVLVIRSRVEQSA